VTQESPITAGSALNISAEMVLQIATGVEEPHEIAERYGITGAAWEKLQQWPPFVNAVAAKKAELEQSGYTHQMMMRMMADAAAKQLFLRTMSNDATIGQLQESYRIFAKMGNLEPRPTAADSGSKFSLTINFPAVDGKPAHVIEIKAPEAPQEENPMAFLNQPEKTE
jgi:hypothetical protein